MKRVETRKKPRTAERPQRQTDQLPHPQSAAQARQLLLPEDFRSSAF